MNTVAGSLGRYLKRIAIVLCVASLLVVGLYARNTLYIESKDAQESAPSGTRYAPLNDELIAYSEVRNGADTTVVFVGGLSAWHETWQRTIDALKGNRSYNYVAMDLPPFGYSVVGPNASYDRGSQAQRISAFLQYTMTQQQSSQVILVAHSYGAGPAAEAVFRDTRYAITKFIVIDGVLNVDEPHVAPPKILTFAALRTGAVGLAIHIQPLLLNRLKSFVYITDHIDADLLSLYTRSFDTRGTTHKLSDWLIAYVSDSRTYMSNSSASYTTLGIPVRVIWGERDTLTPPALSDVLVRTIPDVKRYMLAEVGHIPMIEDYTQFDTVLKKALAE